VAEVGGVPFRHDVPLAFLPRRDLPGYLDQLFEDEYPPARARADERMLEAFGLLPAGTDLRALRRRVLQENVIGFYDERPGRKKLYAVSDDQRLTPANQIVLAHELRHAEQDQYADLHGLLSDAVGDFDDRRLAVMSLLEGDATLVMERFLRRRIPGAEGLDMPDLGGLTLPPDALPDAPPVIRDQLMLPYLQGRDFAQALVTHGGWDEVRKAWSHPPASMEQVLHPEKFEAAEAPRAVTIPFAPQGATPVVDGVLGEMLCRTLLGEGSEGAAAGWGGDLYRVWDVGGRTLLVWRSVWDTLVDARRFHAAVLGRLGARLGPPAHAVGYSQFRNGRFEQAWAEKDGVVTLIASDDPGLLARTVAALP
jgi:hypothetical protein